MLKELQEFRDRLEAVMHQCMDIVILESLLVGTQNIIMV